MLLVTEFSQMVLRDHKLNSLRDAKLTGCICVNSLLMFPSIFTV